jgi:hypothetical protein
MHARRILLGEQVEPARPPLPSPVAMPALNAMIDERRYPVSSDRRLLASATNGNLMTGVSRSF